MRWQDSWRQDGAKEGEREREREGEVRERERGEREREREKNGTLEELPSENSPLQVAETSACEDPHDLRLVLHNLWDCKVVLMENKNFLANWATEIREVKFEVPIVFQSKVRQKLEFPKSSYSEFGKSSKFQKRSRARFDKS